jgi:nucleoside-diphosphate-sugar epimerase
MSCIYGPRQFGTEDQGWVAHFIISARTGRPITIYGNDKQVRDVLFVDDLVRAFLLAVEKIDTVVGEVFNVTRPLFSEVDDIYNLACPASPIHYQFDPVQTTKTSVIGAINMLGLVKRLKAINQLGDAGGARVPLRGKPKSATVALKRAVNRGNVGSNPAMPHSGSASAHAVIQGSSRACASR